jgi:hypothetical protein
VAAIPLHAGYAPAAWMPLRMFSALHLRREALWPDTSLLTVVVTGWNVKLVLAGSFGVVFAMIASLVPLLAWRSVQRLGTGSCCGW